MPLTRQQKETSVKEVETSLSGATAVVFVAYDGLTMSDFNTLRTALHATGGSIRVVPKRLLKIALANVNLPFDPLAATGQVAVAWGSDTVAPAKAIHDFAKDHAENIQLLAGALEGELLTLEQVINLAKLPSRDQLLGQLLSVMVGPVRGLATVLSGAQRSLVQVLAAIQEKKA
ncbi:MAG TPA: 50S ribosomal protein L10 [Candidatus Andersenbacteria bacterium]|nr:50S ribosomal protein L10 [Candidatus Andersenbacteria bacterium]